MKKCESCQLEKNISDFPNRRSAKYCKKCREDMNKEANKVRSSRARQRVRERLGMVDDLEEKIQQMTDGMDKLKGEIERLEKLKKDYIYENESLKLLLSDKS